MGSTFLSMLPYLLLGMFLPTWTSYVIVLLGTKRGATNALSYVGGNATFRTLLGIGTVFVFGASSVSEFIDGLPEPSPPFFGLIAFFLFVIAGFLLTASRRAKGGEPGWLKAAENAPPWFAFAYGFWNVAAPGAQYAYFLGAMGVLGLSGLPLVEKLVLLLVTVALLQAMLLTPIVIYLRDRDRAEVVLGKARDWLAANGNTVLGLMLSGFGLFMAYHAFKLWQKG